MQASVQARLHPRAGRDPGAAILAVMLYHAGFLQDGFIAVASCYGMEQPFMRMKARFR